MMSGIPIKELRKLLWYPHYWGRLGDTAVLLLQVPNYQLLIDLQAIAGYVPSVPRLTEAFLRNTGDENHKIGWLFIGNRKDLPEEAELVWTADFGDGEVVAVGKGEAPAEAVPYVYRLLDGIRYE